MPTERDIRLLLKPLVEKRKDLVYLDRHLLIVPIRSLFVGVYFSRSSSKENLEPRPVAMPLCFDLEAPASEAFPFRRPGIKTWGDVHGYDYPYMRERLHEIRPENWLMTDSDYPEAVRSAINEEMIPNIELLANWESSEEFTCKQGWRHYKAPICFRLAQGDFDWIKVSFGQSKIRHWVVPDISWYCGDLAERVLDHGNDITTAEKHTIFTRMHEREAEAIRNMKLEKHWIPTPFPAEENGLV